LLTQWNDVPFEKVKEEIDRFHNKALMYDFPSEEVLVFIHCREPKEI
jgi:hypothetical protein